MKGIVLTAMASGHADMNGVSSIEDTGRVRRIMVLALLLPLFGQVMHYMKDLPPLWALSKAFPVLSLPLALPVLLSRRPPFLLQWLGVFIWLVLAPSFIAIFTFDQTFFLGLTAQVKILPMLYAFSFLGLLLVLRPSMDEIRTAFLIWAIVTFGVLLALWAFAPQSWYTTGYEFGDAPLLSADDRGNRIRMPMYFGVIAILTAFRSQLMRPQLSTAVVLVLALAVLVGVVKTRATVLATAATLLTVALIAASPRTRIAAFCLAGIGAILVLQIPYVSSAFDTSSASGFDLRWTTVVKAMTFLGDSPLRWFFGVGTITPLDSAGLSRYFNHFFFLADISWLGIIFEYGVLGAMMMVSLLVTTLWLAVRVRRELDSPFLAGLQDYVLFTLIISPLYATMTLQPGEIAVIMATFSYCWLSLRQRGATEEQVP
ncbi:hypothetical protein [Novosphingobium mangrovi (ex Huang et al. 2023)]|uniref:O-antigen polymerase n=1 Tax=Novosphingobium mangrovi (ex Huang et al. 2023) TaxID=2976432 RepID=A0ABT2I521_9SPHN|nr:hypothetical protein [Novosphingobium mangrovi (ex Huang et al. 2023)]MCT2399909.1 hypothetical protein [Novosphingobium mangrovi (ex Huang et al. 2023)]